jgi:hypothetical protein
MEEQGSASEYNAFDMQEMAVRDFLMKSCANKSAEEAVKWTAGMQAVATIAWMVFLVSAVATLGFGLWTAFSDGLLASIVWAVIGGLLAAATGVLKRTRGIVSRAIADFNNRESE